MTKPLILVALLGAGLWLGSQELKPERAVVNHLTLIERVNRIWQAKQRSQVAG